jgi:PAS domain S-box-containing protein
MPDVDPKRSQPERMEHAEAQLYQEPEELRGIVDHIPQNIIVLNPSGKAIYANRVALEYTGLSLNEVQSDDFRDRVFHHEDVQRLRENRQKSLSGTVPFENEQRALGKDGKYRWFLIRYSPLLDENGKVVRWYATGTDIEDRNRVQEALRNALEQVQKSEAKLRQVIDTIPTMAWCNLADGPNEFLNDGMSTQACPRKNRMVGVGRLLSIGWTRMLIVHFDSFPRLQRVRTFPPVSPHRFQYLTE